MKNTQKRHERLIALVLLFTFLVVLTGCGGNSKAIIGTWNKDDGSEVLIFDEDGTCSVPFTYDGGWWESCDRYSIDSEGTLCLSSSKGNIDSRTYHKQKSEADVEENGGYYLSGNTLIIYTARDTVSYYSK